MFWNEDPLHRQTTIVESVEGSKRQMPKIITCFYLLFLLGHQFDFRGIPRAASIPLNGNPTLVLYGEKWQRSRWRFEYRTLQTILNISYSLHNFFSD